jgi:hypothetical protein
MAGEIAHVSGEASLRKAWSVIRLEALYELAFLRIFMAWETCLESVFYRSLCGYASSAGQEQLLAGSYFPTLSAAESAVLGSQNYILWHDPRKVVQRCQKFIKSGVVGCPGLQETVISSNSARLAYLASTRHRIVHDQLDAKRKFDAASLAIAGRTYASSRPGKFLRDFDTSSSPPRRWLEVTILDLEGLARQIV